MGKTCFAWLCQNQLTHYALQLFPDKCLPLLHYIHDTLARTLLSITNKEQDDLKKDELMIMYTGSYNGSMIDVHVL